MTTNFNQPLTTTSNIIGTTEKFITEPLGTNALGGVPLTSNLGTTTAQVIQLPTTTTQTILTTGATTGMGMYGNVLGPNSYGVPENFPLIPADAGCHKCHGTGYKKTLLTRKFKPCKRCASTYGTDVSRIDLHHLAPYHHTTAAPIATTGLIGAPLTATTLGTGIMEPTMIGTTSSGQCVAASGLTSNLGTSNVYTGGTYASAAPIYSTTGLTTATNVLPAGFQTLPANPQCVKCSGMGYRKSKKANQWKGCKKCAHMYGTDLSTIVIPTTQTSMPMTTLGSNVISGGNIY
jgi:hypothetical protein